MSTCFAEILDTLRQYPKGLTSRELSDRMHITPLVASLRLSRMYAYGHAERVPVLKGRPKYIAKQKVAAHV